jgi:hypothetical protein
VLAEGYAALRTAGRLMRRLCRFEVGIDFIEVAGACLRIGLRWLLLDLNHETVRIHLTTFLLEATR